MNIIDLTLPIPEEENGRRTTQIEERKLSFLGISYTGMLYDFHLSSMAGTYIDLPGHIKETDDGFDTKNYPIEKLYRLRTRVIHLDREDGSGGISADELQDKLTGSNCGEALIINALGNKRFDEIENRSVFLAKDAVKWICSTGIHLLVSDVYESKALHGVFYDLFEAGISTVCCPVNLDKLTGTGAKTSVFPLSVPKATQVPCRIIAEINVS